MFRMSVSLGSNVPMPEALASLAALLEHGPRTKADEVTTAILKAAREEFLEFGLRRTAVEDIAQRAGIARVTIYRRFPNKGALMQAVFIRECAEFISDVEKAVTPDDPVSKRVVDGFTQAVLLVRRNKLISRIMQTDPELALQNLTVGAGPVLALARGYLAGQLRRGSSAPAAKNANALAESIMRLGLSFVLTPGSCIDLDNEEAVRDYAERLILPLVVG